MREQIIRALDDIEKSKDVRVLFACESGSRAWGFASVDSDYDVRFVYAHRPDWYLSIDDRRDVIEENLPGDLDVSGWELRKALGLFRKSNPAMLEWLRSPIAYSADERFLERLKGVAWEPRVTSDGQWAFSPERCYRHYLSMARGNIRNYFDTDTVPLKKYLYVIRPLIAADWIERTSTLPPVSFEESFSKSLFGKETAYAINALLEAKRAATELGTGPKIPALTDFIDREFARLEAIKGLPHSEPRTEELNALFRETVGF